MTPRGKTDAKERIVQAAGELFYEQGYQSTTIDQVIERSGVSRPTVYAHFSTKEDLCVAYLGRRRHLDLEGIRAAVRSKTSARAQYMAVIQFVKKVMQASDFRGCGYFNLISEFPDSHHPIFKEARVYVDAFREIIQEGVQALKTSDPKYRKLNVKHIAETYYVLVCGAIMAGQEYRQAWPFDRAIEAVEGLVTG